MWCVFFFYVLSYVSRSLIHLFLQMLKYVLPYKCNCIMISNTFNFLLTLKNRPIRWRTLYKHFVQALLRCRQTGGFWTAAVHCMSYVLVGCDEPWLGRQWQYRRGKRDYTRKLYPTTNPTLKMRRSKLRKCRCFRLPFTCSDYFVCLCWPCHLTLFYNSSCNVWQRVQITTVFSMQCSQFPCYFPSLCYATWFYCPIKVCYELQMIMLFMIQCHRSAVACLLVGPNSLLRILPSDTISLLLSCETTKLYALKKEKQTFI